MQRCGYCDRQSDIEHSEDEKEDHGSAQPAPPTKSRFHRLPPISPSRPLSRCHPPPAGVVLPGQIDGHTLLSAPIGSLFTRLASFGEPLILKNGLSLTFGEYGLLDKNDRDQR